MPELPASLTYLTCSSNQLTQLPDLPTNLKELLCGSNQLTPLPELPNKLEKLWCDGNPLKQLPELPANLKYLDCGTNQLKQLPELPANLKKLTCWFNQLTQLPELPAGLTNLLCTNNYLNVWQEPIKSQVAGKSALPQRRIFPNTTTINLEQGQSAQVSFIQKTSYNGSFWGEYSIIPASDMELISSNNAVAIVDPSGVVTAMEGGSCIITGLYEGIDSIFTRVDISVTVQSP